MFYLKKITHQNTQGLNNLYYCLWINFNCLNLNNHTLNIFYDYISLPFSSNYPIFNPIIISFYCFFCLFPLFYLCYLPIFCLCSLFAFLHGHVTAILTSRESYASRTWTGVLFQLAVNSRPRPHFDVPPSMKSEFVVVPIRGVGHVWGYPALICGFSGGEKNITFFFGRNIARVKIVP